MRKYDKQVTKKLKICFGQSSLINQRNDYEMILDKGGINGFKATLISIFKKTKDCQLIPHQFCTMRSYKQVTKGQNLFWSVRFDQSKKWQYEMISIKCFVK